jgi:DNA-binding transcriptional MerR regulator
MARITIGELAKRAGVGVETVRYYQRRGLFPEPPRQARGIREYSPEALALLRFIRRARGLGFSLREVERLVALRRRGKDTKEVAVMLASKAEDVERKIREMQGVRETLVDLASRIEETAPDERWKLFDADA